MYDILQQQLLAKVEACYQCADKYFACHFPRPRVMFTQRGKIAGSARLQNNTLNFNAVLLKDNPQTFFEEVVPHEICHLLVFRIYGRVRPHGREWKSMMLDVFSVAPATRHSLDVSNVQGKTFPYQCQCGQIALSIRRHNKVVRKQQSYRCRQCGQTLIQAESLR